MKNKTKSISLTAIVPIYNEEKFIKKSVERLINENIFKEILLVDDCSTDGSSKIAKKMQKENISIKYLRTNKNSGKGSAISSVKNFITSTHVVIHDSDLEYFPDDIVEMFEAANHNTDSLILGSRFIGNKDRKNIYKRTVLANNVISAFFSLINFYRISDVATCYKLMPTKFFINENFKEKGFSIEIELLSKFLKFNKSVVEIPIKYEGRTYEEGKKIKTVDGFLYIYSILKYRFFN